MSRLGLTRFFWKIGIVIFRLLEQMQVIRVGGDPANAGNCVLDMLSHLHPEDRTFSMEKKLT